MPEMTLKVMWPDGSEKRYYSPSSIITKYFKGGQKMSLEEFKNTTVKAFDHASLRVEEVHGYACTSAMASKRSILRASEEFGEDDKEIEIISVKY